MYKRQALEGYPLARKGRAGDSLKCALVASTIGGLFSCVALSFFAPQLAKVILKIGSPEYFALCTFGIAAAIGLAGNSLNNVIKGIMSAAFGLILSCVGADPVFGTNRFSFGSYYMLSGIQVVSSMSVSYTHLSMVPYVIQEEELVHIFDVMKEWFRRG